jgi:hypothetical protein
MQHSFRTEPIPIDRRSHRSASADSVAVLGEIVAQLAERVELLEARESLARNVVSPRESRHRPKP